MKKAIFALVVFLAVIVSAANAQLIGDYCSVTSVDVDCSIENKLVHPEMTFHFSCSGASGLQGQLTKMLITIPYTGITNIEASDNFGSMTMLEGPQYVGATEDSGETVIGVMFRKGLLVTTDQQTYDLTVEFDSEMATYSDSVGELSPGGLAVSPKVTIVTTGITETTIPAMLYDFSLTLPEKSTVSEITPAGCQFQGNEVSCSNLDAAAMGQLRVKWTEAPGSLEESLKHYANKITGTFKNWFGGIKKVIKG
jgi:hypothetical protein